MLTIGSVQSMGALSTTGTVNNVNNRCTVYGYTVNNRDCKLYQQSFIKVYIKKNTNHVSAGQEKIGQDHDTEFTRKQRKSTTLQLQISRLVLKSAMKTTCGPSPSFAGNCEGLLQRYCQINTTMSSFIQTQCCRLPIRSLPKWTSYTGTAVERYTASLFS
jgi:hypothetical protein